MKKLLTLLCLFIAVLNTKATAQILFATDTISVAIEEAFDLVGENNFTNQFPQSVDFRWKRNIIEMTESWDCAICDKNNCYNPPIDEQELELSPLAASKLDVHIYPNGNYDGYAFVEMRVEHLNDTTTNAFAYYIFEEDVTTAVSTPSSFSIKVFPNPSQGLFAIEGPENVVHTIQVFNLMGKKLLEVSKGEHRWIDITNLNAGNYWIRLKDNEGKHLGTKMITKL